MKLDTSVSDWNLPHSHELYWSQAFMRPGRTFLDVGAHVGTWTLRLAPLFERVFCFEPDARAVKALRANIETAGLKNVEVIQKAVSNKSGTARLTLTPNPSGNTMFWAESERTDARLEDVEVETVSLDEFCAERGVTDVDFVKVDCEGAEMLVVEGARDMLHDQRPDLFVECHGLFWRRLRALMPWERLDIIDGGAKGLSLVKHRDEWPGFTEPHFRVYQDPSEPTVEDLEELRRKHGLSVQMPRTGWLSLEGQ